MLVPVVVIAAGLAFYPELFWDQFIYKYFWGPVVADKESRPVDGITEGYNVYSTVVYALFLAVALYAMYRATRRLKVEVDLTLIISSLPLFFFGGVARALEDASLFEGTVQYFFISPLIYVVVALIFVGACAVGLVIRRYGQDWSPVRRTAAFSVFVVALEVIYFAVTLGIAADFNYSLPAFVPVILGLVSIVVFHLSILKGLQPVPSATLSTGLLCLMITSACALAFYFDQDWRLEFVNETGRVLVPHVAELGTIFGIALGITAVLGIIGHFGPKRVAVVFAPANLLMFFAHFLDGSATYRGIDVYGYSEKHVLPNFLIDVTGTAATLLVVKFLTVLVIILVIDFWFREDLKRFPNLGNVMKFAMVFLGLAPGTRDAIRIALGV
ncbi:MAG: DUF63 family protein [Methanomassiliicoccales archaeon]|nr:DUF63 family protein [Methanomassiliicoccales archaeon]